MSVTAAILPFRPRIGQTWLAAGGVYAGRVSRGELIVGLRAVDPLNWSDAMGWATSRDHNGFNDWTLPSVEDLFLLRTAFPDDPQARFWTPQRVGLHDAMVVMFTPVLAVHFALHHANLAIAIRYHSLN